MCFVLTDFSVYAGRGFEDSPCAVSTKEKAYTFKTKKEAENYLKNVPKILKPYNWKIFNIGETAEKTSFNEVKSFGNPTKATFIEEESIDILDFFTNAVKVMSEIDRFAENMQTKEQITDMKIMDIRHYLRDNTHKLSAIQMQRLGYYLQELEKERYSYKSQRLIAETFISNPSSLKDKKSIDKINSIVTSKYNPRILDDTDIEYIINKKKDMAFIA